MQNLKGHLYAGVAASILAAGAALADETTEIVWDEVLTEAQGQTVYWHAWGGDPRTNDFIEWAGEQTEALYGVSITHVKLSDTGEAVARVVTERAAGRDEDGAVDLIWLNGPNFQAMKEADLLFGPFAEALPNVQFIDFSKGAPATLDFTIPVEGYESPWRLAKFVFIADAEAVPTPPNSMQGMAAWAAENPGRLSHPVATNFMGATFLKQALLELVDDPAMLTQPVTDEAYAIATAPLWAWYAELRPNLWRDGDAFPENESIQQQMLADGELDIAMSFDPAAAANGVAAGRLPEQVRVFVPQNGSIGNFSFVAIPYNAANQAGAMVVADFLISPFAQAHMQNVEVMGAFSVLDSELLTPEAQSLFDALPSVPQLPALEDLGPTLPEPHPSWMVRVVEDWEALVAE